MGSACHCPIPALTVERQPDGCVRLRCRICRRLEGPTLTTLLAGDTCDGCFGELDGDGFCGSPGCEGSTSGDDPDPEPGSWEWERQHGCMDCGVCDDCIERSRAHAEGEGA